MCRILANNAKIFTVSLTPLGAVNTLWLLYSDNPDKKVYSGISKIKLKKGGSLSLIFRINSSIFCLITQYAYVICSSILNFAIHSRIYVY